MMAPAYTQTCRFDEAMEAYAKAREADADSKFVASLEATTLAVSGKRQEASAMLRQINARAATEYISPVSIAYIYTALGDRDPAFEYLDRAVFDRDPNILGLKSNPVFDGLRADDRYHALLRKMQLE